MRILKFLVGAVICTVAIMALASADVLTTSPDNTFVQDEVKTIAVTMPANCSALDGTLRLTNCTAVLKESFGTNPVKIRIMGGSVPIAPFVNELKIPAVIVPLVNPDNNQHGPNENLRIWNLTYGIKTFLSILTSDFPFRSSD